MGARRHLLGAGAAVLLVVSLAACRSGPADDHRDAPADVAHWTNATDPAVDGAPGAGLEGELTRLDGCVVVVDDQGNETVPLFPTPVAWESRDVLEVDGVRLPVGVLLVGGARESGHDSDVVPAACGDREGFRVFVT